MSTSLYIVGMIKEEEKSHNISFQRLKGLRTCIEEKGGENEYLSLLSVNVITDRFYTPGFQLIWFEIGYRFPVTCDMPQCRCTCFPKDGKSGLR